MGFSFIKNYSAANKNCGFNSDNSWTSEKGTNFMAKFMFHIKNSILSAAE